VGASGEPTSVPRELGWRPPRRVACRRGAAAGEVYRIGYLLEGLPGQTSPQARAFWRPDECDHGTSGSNDRLAGHRPGSRKASGAPVRPRRTRDRLRILFRPSGSRNARLSDVCLRPATFLRRHERWRGCQARDRCERWQRDSWGGATSSCSSGNRRRPNEVSVISAEYGATTHSSMEMAMRSDDARCPRGGSR
jgi:hypothetical protein